MRVYIFMLTYYIGHIYFFTHDNLVYNKTELEQYFLHDVYAMESHNLGDSIHLGCLGDITLLMNSP